MDSAFFSLAETDYIYGYFLDLLEKSRVIRQAPGERCYHIFYQIFSGHRPDLLEILKLHRPLKDYWYVAQAELTIVSILQLHPINQHLELL
jgi:myosin heavy subunit